MRGELLGLTKCSSAAGRVRLQLIREMGKKIFTDMVAVFLPLEESSKVASSFCAHGGKKSRFCCEEVTHVFAPSWGVVEDHFKVRLSLLAYYAERIVFVINDWIQWSVESWRLMDLAEYLLDPHVASRPEGALGNRNRTPCSPMALDMLETYQSQYVESAKAEFQAAHEEKWMIGFRKKVDKQLKVERRREYLKRKRANASYPESEFEFGEPGYKTP